MKFKLAKMGFLLFYTSTYRMYGFDDRLEEEGYPASGSRKRSSMGTGTDDALADTPLTNATVPLHQLASGHDSEKASGRWRRTSGGGLRVLRSSVDGAEGEAGLEGTRVISMVSFSWLTQEVLSIFLL